jgi:hypothetical protein
MVDGMATDEEKQALDRGLQAEGIHVADELLGPLVDEFHEAIAAGDEELLREGWVSVEDVRAARAAGPMQPRPITPEEMREAVARFEAQPPREWRQEIQGEFRQRHEEPPTPWEPVSHGNAWRPVRLSVEPRTLTPEQERICEAVGRAIAGDPDVTLAPNYDGSRLSYFPEAPYPGEVVGGHDGKPYGVLLPSGAVAPLPSDPEVP